MKIIEEHRLALTVFVVYVIGFFSWNHYLGRFGFFEYELIQTRFFSAGFMSVTILSLIVLVVWRLLKTVNYEKRLWKIFLNLPILYQISILIFILCTWTLYFSTSVFPLLPQHWGGARPQIVSIIASSSTIDYLRVMNILPVNAGAGKNPIESEKICLLYQNKEFLLLGHSNVEINQEATLATTSPNRVLILKREQIEALSVIPLVNTIWARQLGCSLIELYK